MAAKTDRKTVITGAHLVDGTGAPARAADISFTDGIITEVGEPGSISTAHAHRVINADGARSTRMAYRLDGGRDHVRRRDTDRRQRLVHRRTPGHAHPRPTALVSPVCCCDNTLA